MAHSDDQTDGSLMDEAMGMSNDTDGTDEGARSAAVTVVSTVAGKTVWTDVATINDHADDISSVRSAHSAASSSRGGGGGGGGGRAASMLARTRNPADKYSRSGGGRRTGSLTSGVSVSATGVDGSAGRLTPRTRSFDSTEGDVGDDSILRQLKAERANKAAAGRTLASSEAPIPEGSKEFSSQSLSASMSLDRVAAGTSTRSKRAGEGWMTGGDNGNEVERARLTLWGIVAAKNAAASDLHGAGVSDDSAAATTPSIPQGTLTAQSGQGSIEGGQDSTPFGTMVQRARSIGQNVYDRGQQLCTRATQCHAAEPHEGHVPRDISSDHGDHDDDENHPEITGGYGETGQNHDAFFFTETRANATSYVSDMFSLLLVLLAAPFYWLYFTFTGRDYHDRYGSSPQGVATSQSTFGSGTKSTASMSQEELYERSEVYLEAKEEDGTLFALLAFHHPGLVPLVDETVESVQLTQALGEDTVKTGDTDLAAALDPDRCVRLNDDDDDTGVDDDKSRGSVDSLGIEDVVSARSGRSRNSRPSRARSRSRSVDARIRRRDKSDDEWVYDINTQKMRWKKGNRYDRNKSKGSSGFASQSIDEMSFDGTLMTSAETCSGLSGNLSSYTSTSSNPAGVVMALSSRRERRRTSTRRDSGEYSQAQNDRGKTTENDRAAWKRNQNGVDSADDIVAAAMAELEDLGNAPSPYEAGHEKERPGGRKGLGMSSFRKAQQGLRNTAYRDVPRKDVPDIV